MSRCQLMQQLQPCLYWKRTVVILDRRTQAMRRLTMCSKTIIRAGLVSCEFIDLQR